MKRLIKYLILLIFFLLPILWLFLIAFKDRIDIFNIPPSYFSSLTLNNFITVFNNKYFLSALLNSISISVISTIISVCFSIISAYSLSRYSNIFKTNIFNFFLSLMILPPIVLALPVYLIYSNLGILGHRISIIIIHIGILIPFGTLILTSFFRKVSVRIDEISILHQLPFSFYFFHIFIKEVKNAIVITTFLMFLISWNEYLFSMLLSHSSTKTIPVLIEGLVTPIGTYWGQIATISLISSVPVIGLSLLFRKYIVTGFTFGLINIK